VLVQHDVAFDLPSTEVQTLRVANGSLVFPTEGRTSITLDGILVADQGGTIRAGSVEHPVMGTVAIRFRVADETRFVGGPDFQPTDTGLWVMDGGQLELHGRPVSETWAKLAAPAAAGATSVLARADLADWPHDGRALVTATNLGTPDQNEDVGVVAARAVRPGVTRLTLDEPLRFDHAGSATAAGEVGLLSHNVRVESVTATDRAHVMYMAGSTGGVSYTEFARLGPTNVLGRYSLHFHLMGDTSRGIIVRGISAHNSGSFWVTVHGSNGITVEDSVGFRAVGAGYFVEEPSGYGNLFLHDLGAYVAQSPRLEGEKVKGVTPHALVHRNSVFWFRVGNALVDNVAVGAKGGAQSGGFFVAAPSRREAKTTQPTVIFHNEAHSNDRYGFISWLNLSPPFHVVDGDFWKNGETGFGWGAYTTVWKAFNIRAVDNGEEDVEALVKNFYLQDSTVRGAPTGILFDNPQVDTSPNRPSLVVRSSLSDHAGEDLALNTARTCPSDRPRCPAVYVQVARSTLASSTPVRFVWQWDPATSLEFVDVRTTARPDLPPSFSLRRPDLAQPSPSAERDDRIGAWLIPSVPADAATDMPPLVGTPTVSRSGGSFRFQVRATDDGSVSSVEFLVNGVPVATRTSGGTVSATWRPTDLPRWAYLAVRVVDDAGGVAYSPTVAL